MKTALFILVPLIIFGIAIYVYLRKEQDKFIPKDKYDEAMDDIYKNRRTNKGKNFVKLMGTSLETGLIGPFLTFDFSNFLILIATVFIAALISILPVTISAFGILFIVALLACLVLFPLLPFLFALFPVGLMHIAQADSNYLPSIIYGWLIYFFVISLGAFAKNRSVFIFIYSILVILLILNIIGCTQAASTVCSNGCPF
jgi:hypothetical protein